MTSKKGYALVMALYFVIIAAITSVGLYAYAYHIYNEAGIKELRSIRGYYAAVNGARYAYVLITQDPVAKAGFMTAAHNGESVTITIPYAHPNPFNLLGRDKLTITIEEYDPTKAANDNTANPLLPSWAQWVPGKYRVTSTYSS